MLRNVPFGWMLARIVSRFDGKVLDIIGNNLHTPSRPLHDLPSKSRASAGEVLLGCDECELPTFGTFSLLPVESVPQKHIRIINDSDVSNKGAV